VVTAPGGGYVLRVSDSPVSPIDTLFESAAHSFKDNSCGVLMTGVGSDGTEGLRKIKARGGFTIGQKQECCAYPNLVQHAFDENVLDKVLPRRGIVTQLQEWMRQRRVH
jgi:chemotaxis response regulator CheB